MSCGLFYFFGRLPILFLYQGILFSFQRSTLFLQSNTLLLVYAAGASAKRFIASDETRSEG